MCLCTECSCTITLWVQHLSNALLRFRFLFTSSSVLFHFCFCCSSFGMIFLKVPAHFFHLPFLARFSSKPVLYNLPTILSFPSAGNRQMFKCLRRIVASKPFSINTFLSPSTPIKLHQFVAKRAHMGYILFIDQFQSSWIELR